MPLYEYRCENCGDRFEILQAMGASSEHVSCPQCDGTQVKKQFSTFSGTVSGSASDTTPLGGCARGGPT